MGQTAAETKREIAETRDQLTQTLSALETKAHAALDWRARLRSNPPLWATLAGTGVAVLIVTGLLLAPASPWRIRRRRSLRRLLQGVRPPDLSIRRVRRPRHVTRVPDDARAWLDAQRAMMKWPRYPEPAARRILIRAAEAGASALAAGLVKILIDRARQPRAGGHSPTEPHPARRD
jgi:hypothetical protein